MQLNSLLFPAPKCSYSIELLEGQLIWVPKCDSKQSEKKQETIVSMFDGDCFTQKKESQNYLTYFEPKIDCKSLKKAGLELLPTPSDRNLLKILSETAELRHCVAEKESFPQINENLGDICPQTTTEDEGSFEALSTEEFSHNDPMNSHLNVLNYQTRTFTNPIRNPCAIAMRTAERQVLTPKPRLNEHSRSCSLIDIPTPKGFSFPSFVSRPHILNRKLEVGTAQPGANLKQNFRHQFITKKDPIVDESVSAHIPCLLLRSIEPSNKIIVCFHGNGEDIYMTYELLAQLKNHLDVNILAVEYPGYGLYQGIPNAETITEDAETVYDFITEKLEIKPNNIIVFGRSIGSGPATHLASVRQIGALILMSAFTSIRDVVRDFAGKLGQYLVKDRFNNLKAMIKVTCPTFFIHGQKDKLVPFTHSEKLHRACSGASELLLPKQMCHEEFNYYEDFTLPLIKFLHRCHISSSKKTGVGISFPADIFTAPDSVSKTLQKEELFISLQDLNESIGVELEVDLDFN